MFVINLSLGMILLGLACFWAKESHQAFAGQILRSNRLGLWVFALASVWFLAKITQLTEADFGHYKLWLLGIFTFSFVGCAIYWQDFLIVRGVAILALMAIQAALDANYATPDLIRPWIAAWLYLGILLMVYAGVYPYGARDILPFLYRSNARGLKCIGGLHCMYGLGLIGLKLWAS